MQRVQRVASKPSRPSQLSTRQSSRRPDQSFSPLSTSPADVPIRDFTMDDLIQAIYTTPIIDNHAHPLLKPSAINKYPLLSITTEANGEALSATRSSLSHLRAVNQLAAALKCESTWEAVVVAVQAERAKPGYSWEKRCFQGIETVLVDDGLDGKEEVFEYNHHNVLTRSKCKRIVRIEKVAEDIIQNLLKIDGLTPPIAFEKFSEEFCSAILEATQDGEVVGFKSVICYRAGLEIPSYGDKSFQADFESLFAGLLGQGVTSFKRIDRAPTCYALVLLTAEIIKSSSGHKKPFQFHTGLGDNDITLMKSSPSHMQPFIRAYPTVPIVLLHSSYPWTREAGYLASVYDNVYADIGEVFPMLSQEGQERVIREILELCPTEKICWSTDGHWFPETYFLAVTQVREVLQDVLLDYVRKKTLTIPQAIKAVQNIMFNTSNKLYGLELPLTPIQIDSLSIKSKASLFNKDLQHLTSFLALHPNIKHVRLQYQDYTSLTRLQIIPIKKALALLSANKPLEVSLTAATLGVLQNDTLAPAVTATGECKLRAVLSSLRLGPYENYASLSCEFRESDGSQAILCPRSTLRRTLSSASSSQHSLAFLLGFEIEVVFLSLSTDGSPQPLSNSSGHAWKSSRSLTGTIIDTLGEICDELAKAGIDLETWHPESATGQYEFVLPPYAPLEACDTLLQAREIIFAVTAKRGLMATFHPKPFADQCGTASHAHLSISSDTNNNSPGIYEPFYAGVLAHLNSITAFSYSGQASYERVQDGVWAGGKWIAWGTQNRECPLRKIASSHWEIKCLDGLANVYLSIAAIIAAGLDGIATNAVLGVDCSVDPASLSEKEREEMGITALNGGLEESLVALEKGELLLGREVVERYCAVKRAEMALLAPMSDVDRWRWIVERY